MLLGQLTGSGPLSARASQRSMLHIKGFFQFSMHVCRVSTLTGRALAGRSRQDKVSFTEEIHLSRGWITLIFETRQLYIYSVEQIE